MRAKRIGGLLLLLACVLFSACAGYGDTPAAEVANAMMQAEVNLPDGVLRRMDAEKADDAYCSPALLAALYGEEGVLPPEFSAVRDYAFFLSSFAHPCELAVFCCTSNSAADALSLLCRQRVSALARQWAESDYAFYTENATVTVIGKYVILAVSSDSAHSLQAARRAIS